MSSLSAHDVDTGRPLCNTGRGSPAGPPPPVVARKLALLPAASPRLTVGRKWFECSDVRLSHADLCRSGLARLTAALNRVRKNRFSATRKGTGQGLGGPGNSVGGLKKGKRWLPCGLFGADWVKLRSRELPSGPAEQGCRRSRPGSQPTGSALGRGSVSVETHPPFSTSRRFPQWAVHK